jgi:hypothetical protein
MTQQVWSTRMANGLPILSLAPYPLFRRHRSVSEFGDMALVETRVVLGCSPSSQFHLSGSYALGLRANPPPSSVPRQRNADGVCRRVYEWNIFVGTPAPVLRP